MIGGSVFCISWEFVEDGDFSFFISFNVYYFVGDYLVVGVGVGFDFICLCFVGGQQ